VPPGWSAMVSSRPSSAIRQPGAIAKRASGP